MDSQRTPAALPATVDATLALLGQHDYVADRRLATAVFLALKLGRPLFLEGEAGVGKTEIAKVLAAALGQAPRAAAVLRGARHRGGGLRVELPAADDRDPARRGGRRRRARSSSRTTSSRRDSCCERPLLQALSPEDGVAPVLLIDELDRADEPFEAYLLEVLSDFQVTIPELGTIRAAAPPVVVITSNRTREIHDAIKRRCLYHWVDYPDAQRELAIVRRKCPRRPRRSRAQIVAFTQRLRALDLFKAPGIAETLDWAEALIALDRIALDPQTVADTLGVLLKYQDDIGAITPDVAARLVAEAQAARAGGVSAASIRPRWPCRSRSCRGARLAENVVHFVRVLRAAGLPVGPAKMLDAAGRGRGGRHRESRRFPRGAGRGAGLAHEHLALFEQAFDLFWRNPRLLEKMLAALLPKVQGRAGEDADRAAGAARGGDAAPAAPKANRRPSRRPISTLRSRSRRARCCRRRISRR